MTTSTLEHGVVPTYPVPLELETIPRLGGPKYAGADWMERCGVNLSPLGRRVADLLGQVWRGIYHLMDGRAKKTWGTFDCDYRVAVPVPCNCLATWDFNHLSALVVLAHDAGMRLSVETHNPRYVRLVFFQRESRTGGMADRLPTLEEHVAMIRESLGAGAPQFPAIAPPEGP